MPLAPRSTVKAAYGTWKYNGFSFISNHHETKRMLIDIKSKVYK